MQLACTEFASQPLTYAIVGAPAHGTLSAATAAGQVTYTPAAGFQGNDSFTYDASSTNGTSNVASVAIVVSAPAWPTQDTRARREPARRSQSPAITLASAWAQAAMSRSL